MATPPLACPVCAALLLPGATSTHVDWHYVTQTLNGWTAGDVLRFITDNTTAVSALAGDDAQTAKLPPITETVRRRPPVPGTPRVTELSGAELAEALMEELLRERDGGEEL